MPETPSAVPRFVASPHQVSTMVGGEAVILGMRDGVYFGLNAVGARAWALLATPHTTAELVAVIEHEFAVEHAQCEADVASLLSALCDRDLVHELGAASSNADPSIGG